MLAALVLPAALPAGCGGETGGGGGGGVDTGGSGTGDYGILFTSYSNDLNSIPNPIAGCEVQSFTLRQVLGAGTINGGGSGYSAFQMEGFPTGAVASKNNESLYYISAASSPATSVDGYSITDVNQADQDLWDGNLRNGSSTIFRAGGGNGFPSLLAADVDNRYLAYTLTQPSADTQASPGAGAPGFPQATARYDPEATDSRLFLRRTDDGFEVEALAGAYNRQLFESFQHFSTRDGSFYTIERQPDGYRFVRVEGETGAVDGFETVFPEYDWGQIDWGQLFLPGGFSGGLQPAHFVMSPDETRIIVYRNETSSDASSCCTPGSHRLWSIDIDAGTYRLLDEGDGLVGDLDWKHDSSGFAFSLLSCAGCAPSCIDSQIILMDRDGKQQQTLVSEPGNKINGLGWRPGGDEIAYAVYGLDYVGRIKAVDPGSRDVKQLISTDDTGQTDPSQPVVFSFISWIAGDSAP